MHNIRKAWPKVFFPYLLYLFALFFLNLALINNRFHFDSISLASWAEEKIIYLTGQQHHILLILINHWLYSFFSWLFHVKSALIPLSIFTCFVGACGVIVFLFTLNTLFNNKTLAVFGSLGLAFSLNYWKYSTLLETHIIPTFFLIASLFFLSNAIKKQSQRYVFYAGIFSCLSLFSSGANIVFIPAFIALIIYAKSPAKNIRIKYLFTYCNTILLCWLLTFVLFGSVIASRTIISAPDLSISRIISFYLLWFKGQLYSCAFSFSGLYYLLKCSINAIFQYNLISLSIFSLAILYLFSKNKKVLFDRYPNITFSAFIAAVLFFTSILFYEPYNYQRYTPLLIFIWLIICLLVKDALSRNSPLHKKVIVFLFVPFLFMNNLILSLIPDHSPRNNLYLQETILLKNISGELDVIIISGNYLEKKYLSYFFKEGNFISEKQLRELILSGKPAKIVLAELQKKVESALDNGGNVFIVSFTKPLDRRIKTLLDNFYSTAMSKDYLQTRYNIHKYTALTGMEIYRCIKLDSTGRTQAR